MNTKNTSYTHISCQIIKLIVTILPIAASPLSATLFYTLHCCSDLPYYAETNLNLSK